MSQKNTFFSTKKHSMVSAFTEIFFLHPSSWIFLNGLQFWNTWRSDKIIAKSSPRGHSETKWSLRKERNFLLSRWANLLVLQNNRWTQMWASVNLKPHPALFSSFKSPPLESHQMEKPTGESEKRVGPINI